MNLRHFENKARQTWWLVHIEAWRQSGLNRTDYCRQHRLTRATFNRWLNYLTGKETARKHAEYQAELRREKRLRKPRRQRYAVRTDLRNAPVQAFWAMHVDGDELERHGHSATIPLLCIFLRRACANGAIGWKMARSTSTGAPIFIPQLALLLALVVRFQHLHPICRTPRLQMLESQEPLETY
ncbi:MAG: hypothetical protein HC850_18220 [Rhodomicrobium sp.]|nr:hypothetical protein [Rhodomicrobium sp.]